MANDSLQKRRLSWPEAHALAVFLILCFYLICPLAPLRWADLYHSYGKVLIISVSALYFYKMRLRGCLEAKLVILYAIWMFVTRLLNTDYYLQNELDLVLSRVLCCVVLPAGLLLDADGRRRLLDAVAVVFCAFFFVSALLGLFCCITGSYVYLPPEDACFGIDLYWYYKYMNFLCLFSTNRTISSVWLYLAWCLTAYLFFRCHSKSLRIVLSLVWIVFFVAIALSFTRTIKFALSISVAMLVLLLCMKPLADKRLALRLPLFATIIVLSLLLSYGAQELVKGGVSLVSSKIVYSMDRSEGGLVHYHPLEDDTGTQRGVDFSDPRSTKESLSNISNRSEIYATFLPTLREDPARIVRGCYSSKVMDIPHKYTSVAFWHMHNFLLQVFMLTGLPGFLLVFAFTVLLVRRMILLFFSSRASLSDKLLTLPLTGLLLYSMFETLIFTDSADYRAMTTDIRELMFFLLAGLVLARSYELYPACRHGRQASGAPLINE